LDKVRDIAPISFEQYEPVYNYFIVQFQTSEDNGKFVKDAEVLARRFYSDVGLIRALNLSLFEDFDISLLSRGLMGLYNVVGLNVIPFHFREYPRDVFSNSEYLNDEDGFWVLTSYFGEEVGSGFYECYGHGDVDDPQKAPVLMRTFREVPTVDNTADIYWEDAYSRSFLVGFRNQNRKVFLNPEYIPEGFKALRCFWPIADRGIMPVGVSHGARMLWGVDVKTYV
jgi:hypothetical protein